MRPTAFIFILMLAILSGCEKDLPDEIYGTLSAEKKMLIAGTDSAFKKELVRQLINNLGTTNLAIRVTGLKSLPDIDTEDFNAILLISSIQAGKIDGQAEQFIKAQAPSKKIVLFCTRGSDTASPGWAKFDLGVDTVTSASIMDRTSERVKQIAMLIDKRIRR